MKRILITGANSYIGTSFEDYVKRWPDKYQVDTISLHGDAWREKSFAEYDVILHVAGVVHIKETRRNASLYYQVNRDLTIEVAQKAKNDNVKQFVFLSSMSVYGMDVGVVKRETAPNPKSHYGKSKLQAEDSLNNLADDNFYVAIIRPPMIYGKGCKGNYKTLVKFALSLPFFPYVNNRRSMIYIENLSEFIRLIIDNYELGIFLPQNKEYINTSEMVNLIAKEHGKKILLIREIGWVIKIVGLITNKANKAFGSLIYENDLSKYKNTYQIYNLKRSIESTENIS